MAINPLTRPVPPDLVNQLESLHQKEYAKVVKIMKGIGPCCQDAHVASGVLLPAGIGHPEFLRIVDEIRALHVKKSSDYGTGTDPFRNIRASAAFGVEPWVGALIRANDKMARLQNAAGGQALVNESIEDSLLDLANYAIIALALRREAAVPNGVPMDEAKEKNWKKSPPPMRDLRVGSPNESKG